MSKAFESKRSILWLGGMLLLVFGFLAAAILLPATAPAPEAPDIHVPRMQNVPPPDAPKLKLDVEKQEKAP